MLNCSIAQLLNGSIAQLLNCSIAQLLNCSMLKENVPRDYVHLGCFINGGIKI
jgi:hypothetical protein